MRQALPLTRRDFFRGAMLACLPGGRLAAQLSQPAYRRALAGYDFAFPRDHGSHPDFRLEWWYYTGHLADERGRRFGYELTFFRVGMERVARNPSRWNIADLHVAHFALSEPTAGRFRYFERVNRRGPGIAHAREGTLDLQNESWTARIEDGVMKVRAYGGGILLDLSMSSAKPPVAHGVLGVSQKSDGEGEASHYYSMTRLATRGLLSFDGEAASVDGESWMDHEFGTNQLGADQAGWDWFGLQLDTNEELMVYQMRLSAGGIDANSSGTLVNIDGSSLHLTRADFLVTSLRTWESPGSQVSYRLDWEIEVPSLNARLQVRTLLDDQELVTTRSTGIAYWEGAVEVTGAWREERVTGRGYVELTGYREDHRPDV